MRSGYKPLFGLASLGWFVAAALFVGLRLKTRALSQLYKTLRGAHIPETARF